MAKNKAGGSDEKVFKLLLSIDDRATSIEERLGDMVTKDHLDHMRNKLEERINEVRVEVRSLGRAVDKDSVTIMDYEKRIARLEKRVTAR